MGRIYQQTFVETYSVAEFALYTSTHPIKSADLLNSRVIPLFVQQQITLLRILADRGIEFCGKPDTQEYERIKEV